MTAAAERFYVNELYLYMLSLQKQKSVELSNEIARGIKAEADGAFEQKWWGK